MSNYNNHTDPIANDDWNAPAAYMREDIYESTDNGDQRISHETIKQVVGRAIARVHGVLGLKGGITDIFKSDEDLTRGISVHTSGENRITVSAKVIAELGYSEAELLIELTAAINTAMQNELGLAPEEIDIEITNALTREEFEEKYGASREIN